MWMTVSLTLLLPQFPLSQMPFWVFFRQHLYLLNTLFADAMAKMNRLRCFTGYARPKLLFPAKVLAVNCFHSIVPPRFHQRDHGCVSGLIIPPSGEWISPDVRYRDNTGVRTLFQKSFYNMKVILFLCKMFSIFSTTLIPQLNFKNKGAKR